jgi:hypothetical protein
MNNREKSFQNEILNLEKKYSSSLNQISELNSLLRKKELDLESLHFNLNDSIKSNKVIREIKFNSGRVIQQKINKDGLYYYIDKNSRETLPQNKVERIMSNEKIVENVTYE